MPLGCTNKATLGCQTAVSDRTGLTSELWLSVHSNEHTINAFLVKCTGGRTRLRLPTRLPPIY